MRLCVLPILAACGLAACATIGPDGSYVAPLSAPDDASTIASGTAIFLTTQLPPAMSTIAFDPVPPAQSDNPLTPALADALRHQGFAVASGPPPAGAHGLRYRITSDDIGDLVRLAIDGREAARFYVRNAAGTLQPGGPFTVQQREATR